MLRYRTRGEYLPGAPWTYQHYTDGGPSTGTGAQYGTKSYMADMPSPNYRKRSAAGEIIMNYLDQKTTSRVVGTISNYTGHLGTNPAYWTRMTGDFSWYDLELPTAVSHLQPSSSLDRLKEVEDLKVQVSTQCLDQVARGDADNWENLAEMSQTVQMLRHPIDSWFAWYRKNYYKSLSLSTANAWLLWRLGLKPLISGVEDTLTSLRKQARPIRVTTRAQGQLAYEENTEAFWTAGSHKRTYRIQKTESHRVRAMSIDTAINTTAFRAGFGGKSLLTLPWELVPGSFVVDYFVNVGAFLGAWAQYLQPASLGRCLVHEVLVREIRTSVSHTTTGGDTILTPALSQATTDTFYRTRVPSLKAPGLVIKSDFRLEDPARVATLLSLIATQVLARFPVGKIVAKALS